jgi:hypothetical protein
MTALVTCDQLVASLTSSLETATPSQLAALSAALTEAGIGGSDNQTLSLAGSTLSILRGNSVTLPAGSGGEDNQTLSLAGSTLSILRGNSVTLPTGLTQAQVDSSIAAALTARTTNAIGFAVRTSPFVQPSSGTRTWATVPLDFNATNPSFGSWNAAKTEFTFSVAGAYMINVTGPIGTFYSASSAGGQVSTAAYLDLSTYQHWVGQSSGVVSAGADLIESAFCGASVPVNATAGQVIKLVLTTVSTGVTTAAGVFGVAGGVQGGLNAVSGMSITPI